MTRLRWDAAWAASIGSTWLWGLGFFFSIHVVLMYGWMAFFLFAVPNAVGLGLFGVVLDRKPDLAAWWARIRARYVGFFLLYQIAAVAITLFAAGAGFWQPVHAPTALAAIAVLALCGCLFGHVADLPGLRRWHLPLLVAGVACALVALACLLSGARAGSVLPSPGIDRRFVGLMLPTLVGFLLGPWLDAQHWQRAVAIRAAGRSVGATYVAGAVVFFGLLCLNAALASAAGLVAVRIPLDGVPEAIVAVTTAAATQRIALVAFGLWMTLALLSTLDSFYVATRALLRDVSAASNSTLLALIPSGLATSPFWVLAPALALAGLGLSGNAPLMAFLMPFATLLIGASACLVAETVLGPRDYDPVVCLVGGVLATVPFALGYYGDAPALVWIGSLGALLPALPVLRQAAQAGEEPVEVESAGEIAVGLHPELAAIAARGSYGFSPDGWFEIHVMPTYADTNSVGNVYFNSHIGFVGKCRELFFYECMPNFDLKTTDFYILTNDFHHKFRREVVEFEAIVVRIRIEKYNRRFVTLEHEILTLAGDIVGRGSQQLMFVTSVGYRLLNIPASVMTAFLPHFQRAASNSNQRPVSAVA